MGNHKKREEEKGTGESIIVSKEKMETEWVECPQCSTRVKSRNLSSHVERVHHKELVVETPPGPISMKLIVFIVVMIVAIAIAGHSLFVSIENDRNRDANNPSNGENDWWEDYTPRYSEGSGDDNWWVNYPDQHPDSGSAVSHPQWVLDTLPNKPVVILVHSDCYSCNLQYQHMLSVLHDHGEDVEYIDLPAIGGGARTNEAFDIYDPDEAQSYIPLTIVVTLIGDGSGDAEVAWHSAEGVTGEDWIRSYIRDSIYYHRQN